MESVLVSFNEQNNLKPLKKSSVSLKEVCSDSVLCALIVLEACSFSQGIFFAFGPGTVWANLPLCFPFSS